MLKSISFMNRLEDDLRENATQNNIIDFHIELRINQNIEVYIVSDAIKEVVELYTKSTTIEELKNANVKYIFISESKSLDEGYSYLFSGEKTSVGLRRSLGALLAMDENRKCKKKNVVTFFSYKGGVGRTTSLALTAAYLSRKGKKVFVIDCDFEAPGLINFFNTSQVDNFKSGLVEYLNDRSFLGSCNIEEYVYDVEKSYSGSGSINLMPAGNIMESHEDLISYLEGLAKIDLQGEGLVKVLGSLIDDVNDKYSPDVILIDSRTGFNNTFGALAQLSNSVVVLAGDDAQNQPGIDYVTKALNEMSISACFVLSIISANFSKRYNNFASQIQGLSSFDAEIFYFDRQNTLEFIGTSLEDRDDLDDFINGENGSTQYQKFFKYIYEVTSPAEEVSQSVDLEAAVVPLDDLVEPPMCSDVYAEPMENMDRKDCETTIQEKVLNDIKGRLRKILSIPLIILKIFFTSGLVWRICLYRKNVFY